MSFFQSGDANMSLSWSGNKHYCLYLR